MAVEMRLFEHPDFDQAIQAARDQIAKPGLTVQLIEKDYYVTETLRVVANHLHGETIFKGGTSLSKGWNLIQRFSEDIDLFINPGGSAKTPLTASSSSFETPLTTIPPLSFVRTKARRSAALAVATTFATRHDSRGLQPSSHAFTWKSAPAAAPTQRKRDRSPLIWQYSCVLPVRRSVLGAEDEAAFDMPLLHYRRTFVEKMFAIHAKVEIFKETA
jgi:hypothetical protein